MTNQVQSKSSTSNSRKSLKFRPTVFQLRDSESLKTTATFSQLVKMVSLVSSRCMTRTQIRRTKSSARWLSLRRSWSKSKSETNSKLILSISKTKSRSQSRTRKPQSSKNLTKRTRRSASFLQKSRTKRLKTTIDTNNFWRPRKTWREWTRIRSTRCSSPIKSKWKEGDRTTPRRWTQIFRDSMNSKPRRTRTRESSRRDSMSWVCITRRSSRS